MPSLRSTSDHYPSGAAYDVCICVHAEQNALLQAARLGIRSTARHATRRCAPCFGCLKELRQAGVDESSTSTPGRRADEVERGAYDDFLVAGGAWL